MAWGRVADGLQLMGFGVFLLLTTLGPLAWSFWVDALALWPVLLVGFGIRMVFERSPAPWGVLLAPVVVVGALAWAAYGREPGLPGEWVSRSLDRPEGMERYTVEARLAATRFDVRTAELPSARLLEGRSASRSDRARLDLRSDGPASVVRLGGRRRHVSLGSLRDAWELRIAPAVPVGLDLDGAFLDGRFDLAGGQVQEIEIEGAFNDLEVRLPRPAAEVPVRLKGVFNSLRLTVPPGTPVRSRVEGPLNDFDRQGAPRDEGPGYDVRVDGVLNDVVVVVGG